MTMGFDSGDGTEAMDAQNIATQPFTAVSARCQLIYGVGDASRRRLR
jgi:hypothetical protein